MFNLPEKLNDFTPYEPLTGEYKIRLDVNESFIEISREEIVAAIKSVCFNRYPDPYSTKAVTAFADLFKVDAGRVTAGNGSDELIGIIAAGLLNKGDKVLTLTPDFSMYGFYSRLYELDVVELPKSPDFEVDIGEIIEYIGKNDIKCLMFSNPCNPTSLGISKSEIKRLVLSTDALVVLDEAYMDFWDESQSMLGEIENYSNLIVLRTCSKSVALASVRLGFAVACETITKALKTVKSPFNVNSLSQAIGTAVLSNRDNYNKSVTLIKQSVDLLRTQLEALGLFERIYDNKTNFVFAKTDKAQQIYEYLLSKSIAVRCFPEHLRICAGTFEENKELIEELKLWKSKK